MKKEEALMNIAHYGHTSNYRLRDEPIKLTSKVLKGYRKNGEPIYEEFDAFKSYGAHMRIRGSRKQRAAHEAIMKETVRKVEVKGPRPPEVVKAVLEGKSAADVKIAELEFKMKELLGMVAKASA